MADFLLPYATNMGLQTGVSIACHPGQPEYCKTSKFFFHHNVNKFWVKNKRGEIKS